ncbi:DUF2059 domain-containing protein [Flavobacterium arcticum]|uniref:DUF2059 domain-containing protein n=1 Tax=Flavobacterium arcticum TaxID=1784713 RepID=A0A345HCG4_9FLAO|nr:DUF2059 domain-containing protein [Flavobacterium arcticum]AXG74274.1 DUF2059 domain-containing protein [Flavobacterium arcticum]KAF2508136.1 DUF2059 domain-containing protein [Flavobacterium arcticum]
MKKLFFAFAFILIAQLGFAQDAAFKADVKKLLDLSGATGQMDVAKKQVISMVPADKQEAFTKEFEASLQPVLEIQQNFYLTEFTHDEVKQIIKFYESPAGKKMAQKAAKLTEVTMPIIQEWSMELQGIIMKYQG